MLQEKPHDVKKKSLNLGSFLTIRLIELFGSLPPQQIPGRPDTLGRPRIT
jgi:hypothetical protein